MYLSAEAIPSSWPWSQTVLILGLATLGFAVFGAIVAGFIEFRKTKIMSKQDGDLRQLVSRYEKMAENGLDAQQRVAADLSELRSRTVAIEQILRTVD
jgi:hypothetical protein